MCSVSDYCAVLGDYCTVLLYYYYYHYYYYSIGIRCARPGESKNTLSVQRPQPHTTNPLKEEKDKIVGDKKERADHANRKALALLLMPASPTPSNTGSLRSFQRDTERTQRFCDTEKSYNEEARTSAYMSNQCTTSNTRRHIRQRQCTAQRMHWITQLCYRSTMGNVAL